MEHALGIPLSGKLSPLEPLCVLAQRIGEVNVIALAITLSTLAAIMLLSGAAPRLPGPLFAVAAATVVVYMLGLDGVAGGVEVVGEVPGGCPRHPCRPST